MIRTRALSISAVVAAALASSACKHADDPLEPFRKQCTDLQTQGALKAGLAIDDCAKALKVTADENDPATRAEGLIARMQALVNQGAGKPGPQQDELRVVTAEVQTLGKPAAPVLQSHLAASHDPDLRLALANAMIGICFDDCTAQKYDCIVPALLEGMAADKPAEVRQVSVVGLTRCTGKSYGDDPAAWTNWWASVKGH